MDDLITKYDAMEAVRNTPHFDAQRALIAPEQAMEAIGALDPLHGPSLLEELRPKGKWIKHEDEKWGGVWHTCSNCYQDALHEQDVYNNWIQKLSEFCPNCGAKIVKEDPEE